ncbi:hypothetical protein TD95_004301 [Thielaviopsis punctulata]|uniref:tRNA ligase n=1 Tax=Thielaviopsis punctulata TaxID=72032 RepID=A0A0F4Z9L3_9PEZI|nr:hypothetical protein TD95_004301 [Thielaviopsis punctulata]
MSLAPPFAHQDPDRVEAMIAALEAGRKNNAGNSKKRGGGGFRKNAFTVENSPDGIQVFSWKLSDWDYKMPDLPTYARGLFTSMTRNGTPEISVRGYDKFFNIGEVPETKWENIQAQTRGPYELTLKENGCIIFISGLEDGSILVCSKHSTGPRGDNEISHSVAGENHLHRQLTKIGRNIQDLARELRARNATAVCELCDDEFEEHILQYGPEKAGLYLHGINLNLPEFSTYPSVLVQQFAEDWNFKKTDMLVMDDIDKVRSFLEGVAESGAYDGRDVEGFVIRCRRVSSSATATATATASSDSYSDWFFKYKFEEPYLMYRQWRECTKAIINGNKPRINKHKTITEKYLLYAKRRLARDPALAKNYAMNHGIISLREDFLAAENLRGLDAANLEPDQGPESFPEVTKDVVITAVATIGCGKTTIGLALTQLFGWAHVQNDNIYGSKRPPRFVAALKEELASKPAVFADRNNAQRHERKQLITDMRLTVDEPTLVALNFKHPPHSIEAIRSFTWDRVMSRGDNHQTIRAASETGKFMGVVNSFLSRFESVNPDEGPDAGFDLVIDLDPLAGSRANLEIVVRRLHESYPNLIKQIPSETELDAAFQYAIDYKPDVRYPCPDRSKKQAQQKQQQHKKPKMPVLEYMSVSVPAPLVMATLEKAFSQPDLPAEYSSLYSYLKQHKRVQSSFHVTLMHRMGAKENAELWKKYKALYEEQTEGKALGECGVILERVVFNDKIMAIVVRLHDTSDTWICTNKVAHVTVGTHDKSVKPKESNDLLAAWLEHGTGSVIREIHFEDRPEVKCGVYGVAQRVSGASM